ncbi:Transcription termination factor mitochondrial/chloroplastic protein [Dioscorea alata]|uniref:Transcription termination factor mitochondrial/chloroplastic protein n=1 Tax=Dioscorea alata TaxID=55571 RepID=A0ACB7VGY9_DIOAL|nr:Transcription termination factor mitochondrial/chloroplastic protein [Dioscorea alata]
MAIVRVLVRRSIHRILSKASRVSSSPFVGVQSFSKAANLSGVIPLEFTGIPQASDQALFSNLLQRFGFPRSQSYEFIQKNRFLLDDSCASDVEKCVEIILSLGFSEKSLVSILSCNPRLLELGFLRKWQLGFMEMGFQTIPPSLVQNVLEQAGRFHFEPEALRSMVLELRNLGFSDDTVIRVLQRWPVVFLRASVHASNKVEFLKVFGLKNAEIDHICHSYPDFLAFSIENRLKPLFEEFRDLGFSRNEVRKVLIKNPKLLLGMEVGELSRCVDLIKSLKCRMAIKLKILSKGPLNAAIDAKLRVDCLCRHGLTRRDAFKVLAVEPRSILYELEDVEKKIEFLLDKLGCSIECLAEYPEYLGVNFEKKIMPRYNVVEHLKSKGALGFEVGLKHLVKLSRHKFYNLLVKPYPECEEMFGGLKKEVQVKARHPAGMWKLFKPPKFSNSAEDVRNMKLFMESLV